jgi:hypothetical protein
MHFNEIRMTLIYDSVEISICSVGVCGNNRFVSVANAHQQEEYNIVNGLVPDLLMTLSLLLVSYNAKL